MNYPYVDAFGVELLDKSTPSRNFSQEHGIRFL